MGSGLNSEGWWLKDNYSFNNADNYQLSFDSLPFPIHILFWVDFFSHFLSISFSAIEGIKFLILTESWATKNKVNYKNYTANYWETEKLLWTLKNLGFLTLPFQSWYKFGSAQQAQLQDYSAQPPQNVNDCNELVAGYGRCIKSFHAAGP